MDHTAWFTVEQMAAHLQVSKETIYRWLERGRIPARRVGKQWHFQSAEVNEWVKRCEATKNLRMMKAVNEVKAP